MSCLHSTCFRATAASYGERMGEGKLRPQSMDSLWKEKHQHDSKYLLNEAQKDGGNYYL